MAYVLVDDGMAEHPKIEALSDREFRAHFRAMCWCARRGTDGHVPPQSLRTIGATPKVAASLVEAGVWDKNGDGGFVIHDWDEFNPPTDPEERKRWYGRRRARNHRKRRAEQEGEEGSWPTD